MDANPSDSAHSENAACLGEVEDQVFSASSAVEDLSHPPNDILRCKYSSLFVLNAEFYGNLNTVLLLWLHETAKQPCSNGYYNLYLLH